MWIAGGEKTDIQLGKFSFPPHRPVEAAFNELQVCFLHLMVMQQRPLMPQSCLYSVFSSLVPRCKQKKYIYFLNSYDRLAQKQYFCCSFIPPEEALSTVRGYFLHSREQCACLSPHLWGIQMHFFVSLASGRSAALKVTLQKCIQKRLRRRTRRTVTFRLLLLEQRDHKKWRFRGW